MTLTTPPAEAMVNPFESIMRTDSEGRHYWSARELMPLLGYPAWQHFAPAIERATATAVNQGLDTARLFTVNRENSGGRPREDVHLARFAAYLVAMNGDPRKPEVAAAQAYFAIRTREAETAPTFEIPTDYPSALRAAAEQADRAIAAEAALAVAAPKADAFDGFLGTTGDYSVNDAAKMLSRTDGILTGQGRLFDYMEAIGWIYRDARRKAIPYQAQIDNGRLVAKAQWHYHPETGERVVDAPQVRITAKGLEALRTKYLTPAVTA